MTFNFDKFKGVIDRVKNKGTEYAGLAVDKTKDAARLARLSVDLGSEKEALKRAFLELGRQLGIRRVLADTLPDNTASQHVLQKCGFCFLRQDGNLWWEKNL